MFTTDVVKKQPGCHEELILWPDAIRKKGFPDLNNGGSPTHFSLKLNHQESMKKYYSVIFSELS